MAGGHTEVRQDRKKDGLTYSYPGDPTAERFRTSRHAPRSATMLSPARKGEGLLPVRSVALATDMPPIASPLTLIPDS
jgi:hypothetical protein